MLAYDYPLLGVFLSTLYVFLWVIWIIILFRVVTDIFRSEDLSGVGKAIWLLFVIVLPYLGVFVYVIARGTGMERRHIAKLEAREEAFREYVRSTADGGGVASELSTLADLRDRGVISPVEFEQQKSKLLA
jgi:hypothetical protein